MAKQPEKWELRVFGPARPMHQDGNALWRRDYATRAAANRAAANVRKMYPGSIGELARFVLGGPSGLPFFTCHGVRDRDVFTLWDERDDLDEDSAKLNAFAQKFMP